MIISCISHLQTQDNNCFQVITLLETAFLFPESLSLSSPPSLRSLGSNDRMERVRSGGKGIISLLMIPHNPFPSQSRKGFQLLISICTARRLVINWNPFPPFLSLHRVATSHEGNVRNRSDWHYLYIRKGREPPHTIRERKETYHQLLSGAVTFLHILLLEGREPTGMRLKQGNKSKRLIPFQSVPSLSLIIFCRGTGLSVPLVSKNKGSIDKEIETNGQTRPSLVRVQEGPLLLILRIILLITFGLMTVRREQRTQTLRKYL